MYFLETNAFDSIYSYVTLILFPNDAAHLVGKFIGKAFLNHSSHARGFLIYTNG